MKSPTTTILVATGALLVGGIATAAFMSGGKDAPLVMGDGRTSLLPDGALAVHDAALDDGVRGGGDLQYADVIKVDPVTRKEKLYATVVGSEAVRETTTTTSPREVCQDVVVQERAPERDGNVGGTVAGAVIGGLIGNQIGGGSGRKAATAAGAVAGGVIGNQVDKRHVGGQVISRTERQCHTENATSESSRITGYKVTYRNADGSTGTMHMDSKPGERVALGDGEQTVGYDVTYRFQGSERTVRMSDKPVSDRLPVIDGQVVLQSAAVDTGSTRQ